MTRHEAVREMKNGKKIRHRHFSSNEFVYMKNGSIMSEDGYNFNNWWYTTGKDLGQDGWSVVEEK